MEIHYKKERKFIISNFLDILQSSPEPFQKPGLTWESVSNIYLFKILLSIFLWTQLFVSYIYLYNIVDIFEMMFPLKIACQKEIITFKRFLSNNILVWYTLSTFKYFEKSLSKTRKKMLTYHLRIHINICVKW